MNNGEPKGTAEELYELVHDFRISLQALQEAGCRSVEIPAESAIRPDLSAHSSEPNAKEDTRNTLALVRETIGDCQRCSLSETRQNIVFGVGSEQASLMFVGEAPGAEEDKRGEPFVGAAGQLLDKMIVAMGFTRKEVYIANVLKCRPPGNRDPKLDEVAACQGFLAQQIEAVSPQVIVTLGKPAAHLLLASKASMSRLRGSWQDYNGIPVMPTFHPAYLLRDPSKKRAVWGDLQTVMKLLNE
jgi:DNA polymerase